MKAAYAEPLPKRFRPVMLTLETLEELVAFRALAGYYQTAAEAIAAMDAAEHYTLNSLSHVYESLWQPLRPIFSDNDLLW